MLFGGVIGVGKDAKKMQRRRRCSRPSGCRLEDANLCFVGCGGGKVQVRCGTPLITYYLYLRYLGTLLLTCTLG